MTCTTLRFGWFLLSLTFCQLGPLLALRCPAPFSLEAGKCVFVSTAQSHSWCSANRQCASMGGELINLYGSLKQLPNMPSVNPCSCRLWLGVTDLGDKRGTSRSGWKLINGHGDLPLDDSLWNSGEPNKANHGCIITTKNNLGKLSDNDCTVQRGFICEYVEPTAASTAQDAIWKRTPFKRTSYHSSSEYCYTDLLNVDTSVKCISAAMKAGNCQNVLYNSKLRACHLLLFTDAQVEEKIENSADWVKFSVY